MQGASWVCGGRTLIGVDQQVHPQPVVEKQNTSTSQPYRPMSGCQGLAGSVDYAIKKIRKTENSLRCKRKNERERVRFSFFTRARALEGKSGKRRKEEEKSRLLFPFFYHPPMYSLDEPKNIGRTAFESSL